MRKTLLSLALFAAALTAAADSQTIKLTTQRATGQPLTLLVNATRAGVTVDWGDGTPVSYVPEKPGGVQEITGTVLGSTITLEAAKGLVMLSAEDCELTAIDLSKATEMRSLYLQHNLLTSINVSVLPALTDLNLADNALASVTLSSTKLPNIETLDLSGNAFTTTSFSYATTNLRYLNIANNSYKTMTISKAANLDALIVSDNQLTALGLPGNISLLDARNNNVTKITMPPAGMPMMQQCLLDDNALATLDLSASSALNTLTIARNGAQSVVLPAKAKLQVYDCSDNALSFGSLPVKTYAPTVYFAYAPQSELDITGNGLHEGSWGSGNLPWLLMNPDYATRAEAQYQLDLSAHKDGSATNSVVFDVYAVQNGEDVLLEKASATQKTLDYSLVGGKMTLLKEFRDVYIKMTDPAYPDLIITTNHFASIDGTKTAIDAITTDAPELSAPAYDLQGRRVSEAVQGLYIQNGKKIIVK